MIANTWHFLLVSVEGVRSPSAYTVMFFFCWIRSIYWKCLQVYGSVCKTATIKSWMDGSMHDERARFFLLTDRVVLFGNVTAPRSTTRYAIISTFVCRRSCCVYTDHALLTASGRRVFILWIRATGTLAAVATTSRIVSLSSIIIRFLIFHTKQIIILYSFCTV